GAVGVLGVLARVVVAVAWGVLGGGLGVLRLDMVEGGLDDLAAARGEDLVKGGLEVEGGSRGDRGREEAGDQSGHLLVERKAGAGGGLQRPAELRQDRQGQGGGPGAS